MKKIWFAVLVLLVSGMLAGCQESDMQFFEVEVVDLSGNVVLTQSIGFDEDGTVSIVDLIDQEIGLDYSVSTYGTFVNGVSDIYPTEYGVTYNFYFSLLVNDEMSSVGLDQIELADDLKITFKETTMLDETDLEVDRLIQLFIDDYLSTYVSDQAFEHYVLAAIKQLELKGYLTDVLSDTLPASYLSMSRDTIANTFKMTVVEKAFEQNLDLTKTALSGFVSTNPYDAVSLLTALSMTEGSSAQIDALVNDLVTTTPAFMDADYAGMILLALAPYAESQGAAQTITDMEAYIQTMLTENGVESWGSANSSSTATVILGLVAQGINPRDVLYTTNGIDLIEALLTYEVDGAYKWQLADEQADMAFSTPQVFSALVAYKMYRDVYSNPAFNLFGF